MSSPSGIRSVFRSLAKVCESQPADEIASARILVVDDQPILRCAIAEDLAQAGYVVAEAENATDAIALIGAGASYELILTDVDMPGPFNGLQLAEFIKYVSPATRVVVMSGGAHDFEQRTAIDLFLGKPIGHAELRRHVAATLARFEPSASP